MTISFNTGTATSNGVSSVVSLALTIPAGVLAGDVIFIVFAAFNQIVTETVQASSTGTAPVLIGSSQNVAFSGSDLHSAIFRVVAGASDAGKVITGSLVSGDTAQWAGALAAYTGASGTSPVDVQGAVTAAGASSTVTCPSEITGVANDWDIQVLGAAVGGAAYTGPAGFTQREKVVDAASGAAAAIYDSNSSVGPAGTVIGGAAFANAGNNSWWAGFTVGLAPPAVPGPVLSGITDEKRAAKKRVLLGL